MFDGVLGIREFAGRFDDDLRTHRIPIELRGILRGEHFDALAAYQDGILFGVDLHGQRTQHGIVFQ